MLRKLQVLVASVLICAFSFAGCSSKSEPESEEDVKSVAEYESEAKEEINKENMAEELDKIEKSVEEEAGEEQ